MFSKKKLLIISHTEHFLDATGTVCGWTPTVREIDFLANHFKEVIHLAVLHPGKALASTTSYQAKNVRFEYVSSFGGASLRKKLQIVMVMPLLWFKMHHLLKEVDLFQFRSPTSIGLMVIPILSIFYATKQGWYKYAGNWMQPNMPLSYRFQKWMLEKLQKRPVTINGFWNGQPAHIHSFENPCLSEVELPIFKYTGSQRTWQRPYSACFVGRMDDAKGVHRIIELLLQPEVERSIGTFHFVGEGPKQLAYKKALRQSKVKVYFHDFCTRKKTFEYYAHSHLILLPSNSEGFPKVVAEAAAFGCIPLVSDVSSIGQYVNETNGFLWNIKDSFSDYFQRLDLDEQKLFNKSESLYKLAEKFTFETYMNKLSKLLQKDA